MARSSASRGTTRSTPWPQAFPAPSNGTVPTAVAFYLSGQLLTEDYYVANKLMKGFIGSANVDTNSRLCMASSVAGHRRAFGTDTVPGCYEDLDQADLIILVGSNAAWCHPVLYQRMVAQQARARRQDRRHRSAPHRHRGRRRPVSVGRARHGQRAVLRAAGASRRSSGARLRLCRRAHVRLCRSAGAGARDRARRNGDGRIDRPVTGRGRALLRLVPHDAQRRHLFLARREPVGVRAPTRSMPSSIAISPPAASASRGQGRSRSPASPTPWAAARWAGSPTSSPRT